MPRPNKITAAAFFAGIKTPSSKSPLLISEMPSEIPKQYHDSEKHHGPKFLDCP